MTREEHRRRRRRWLAVLLAAALVLLCCGLSRCSGVPEPGISAAAVAVR